jgi:hypothetical protein
MTRRRPETFWIIRQLVAIEPWRQAIGHHSKNAGHHTSNKFLKDHTKITKRCIISENKAKYF